MKQWNTSETPWGYLLFWPLFGLRYLLLESYEPTGGHHPVSCSLDERIPFLEGFVIPYLLWYVCIIGMHLWLYANDGRGYRQYSRYLVVTMSISTAVFLLWPSCQNLRPDVLPRTNFLTQVVAGLYRVDTNTNVFPSEHVIGSVGFFLGAWYHGGLRRAGRLLPIGVTAWLTAAATVFLKQHSILDVAAALPVCMIGWWCAYGRMTAMCARTAEAEIRFRYG